MYIIAKKSLFSSFIKKIRIFEFGDEPLV